MAKPHDESLVHEELEAVDSFLDTELLLLSFELLQSLVVEAVLLLLRAGGLLGGAQNAPSRRRSVKNEKTGSGGGRSF